MRKKLILFTALLLTILLSIGSVIAKGEDFAAEAAASDTPATPTVSAVVTELTNTGYSLTLSNYTLLDNGRQTWVYLTSQNNYITLVSNNQSDISQVMVRTETLHPGDEWMSLCRTIPELSPLSLPDSILSALRAISLDNGSCIVTDAADSYTIRVGGVMDTRSVWDLHFPTF